MAYVPHHRITMSGTLQRRGDVSATNIEIFSMSLACDVGGVGPITGPLTGGVADEVFDLCIGYFRASETGISNDAQLQEVKFAAIGPDGKYLAAPTVRSTGTYSLSNRPTRQAPQVSYRVSLDDGEGLRPTRGGWYVPYPDFSVNDNRQMITSDTVQAATSAQTFLIALNDVDTGTYALRAVIASSKGSGRNAPVRNVRVGTTYDTIRTRRNGLQEVYANRAV